MKELLTDIKVKNWKWDVGLRWHIRSVVRMNVAPLRKRVIWSDSVGDMYLMRVLRGLRCRPIGRLSNSNVMQQSGREYSPTRSNAKSFRTTSLSSFLAPCILPPWPKATQTNHSASKAKQSAPLQPSPRVTRSSEAGKIESQNLGLPSESTSLSKGPGQ